MRNLVRIMKNNIGQDQKPQRREGRKETHQGRLRDVQQQWPPDGVPGGEKIAEYVREMRKKAVALGGRGVEQITELRTKVQGLGVHGGKGADGGPDVLVQVLDIGGDDADVGNVFRIGGVGRMGPAQEIGRSIKCGARRAEVAELESDSSAVGGRSVACGKRIRFRLR